MEIGFHARIGGAVLDLHACEVLDPALFALLGVAVALWLRPEKTDAAVPVTGLTAP